MILFSVLGSGSKGNAIFVNVDGHKLLLDAGFSNKALSKKLDMINKNTDMIQDIFISHQHGDHVQAIPGFKKYHPDCRIHFDFIHGKPSVAPEFTCTPFLLSHDEPCYGFVIQDKAGNRLCYIPDTGFIPENVYPFLFDCNAIIIEFNHDTKLLVESPYPAELQERIFSDIGHLNNEQGREILRGIAWEGLKYVICFHLSEKCNNPALARYEAEAGLKEGGAVNCQVFCAEQNEVGEMLGLI